MKKKLRDYGMTILGIILIILGILCLKLEASPKGIMQVLPFLCIGLGCGTFGYGAGNLISRTVLRNSPDIQKQIEIEKNDERNIQLSNCAKAKAYDIMIFVFGALMVSFAIMGIDLIAVLLLVFSYLLVVGCSIYYRCKYDKEM